MRPSARFRLLWTLFFLLSIDGTPASAAPLSATQVIPVGREATVQGLLEPWALGKPVADGFILHRISIEADRFALIFGKCLDAPAAAAAPSLDGCVGKRQAAVVDVLHPANGGDGTLAGRVRLMSRRNATPALMEALKAHFDSVPATVALPWVTAAESEADATGRTTVVARAKKPRTYMVPVAWAMLLGLLATALRALRRDVRAIPKTAWGALLAVTALALAVRLRWSPWAYLHEYSHVDDNLAFYLFDGTGVRYYGATGPALYKVVAALSGQLEKAIFGTNLVLATLTAPLVTLLAQRFFRHWPKAVTAGAVMALLPMHVRFSASEELSIVGVFFGVSALAALAAHVEDRRGHWLPVALLASLLTIESRPEMVLFPAVLGLYLLVMVPHGEWRGLFGRPFFVASLTVAAFTVHRIVEIQANAGAAGTHRMGGLSGFSKAMGLVGLLDRSVTPGLFLALAAAALVMFVRERSWRLPLFVTLVLTGYLAVLLSLFRNPPPSNLRTQLFTLPFFALIAANAIVFRVDRYPEAMVKVGRVVLVVLALGFGFKRGLPMVTATFDAQQEWTFLREAMPKVPAEATTLLTIGPHSPATRNMKHPKIAVFPRHLLPKANAGLTVVDLDAQLQLGGDAVWPEPGPGVLYYEGMYCFSSLPEEPLEGGLHARCKAVRERYEMTPVATASLPGPGYSRMNYAAPPFGVGLYALVAKRAAAAPEAQVSPAPAEQP